MEAIVDARTSDVIKSAAKGGFNINGANNGVLLDHAFHSGAHPKYIERVLKKISELDELSNSETSRRLQLLVDNERLFLQKIEQLRLAALQAGRNRVFLK